ncbi:hypothetical protein BV25DRAFT_948738 [Artomyces pyxidatus]|uniref:Uncharacterized protein n=1 Tax=Artomyces pyxidatus TaxID=48021 RepID=A0ACB8SWP4_9AGAM|nr:hypothetical protein BV25DRAFT_948738 [Artomyces pyxidatus]
MCRDDLWWQAVIQSFELNRPDGTYHVEDLGDRAIVVPLARARVGLDRSVERGVHDGSGQEIGAERIHWIGVDGRVVRSKRASGFKLSKLSKIEYGFWY